MTRDSQMQKVLLMLRQRRELVPSVKVREAPQPARSDER